MPRAPEPPEASELRAQSEPSELRAQSEPPELREPPEASELRALPGASEPPEQSGLRESREQSGLREPPELRELALLVRRESRVPQVTSEPQAAAPRARPMGLASLGWSQRAESLAPWRGLPGR